MIALYTKDKSIAERLDDIEIEYTFISDDVLGVEGLFICGPLEHLELCTAYPGVKILVLSSQPNFSEGMALLQKGIRGYGNLYMQKVHLLQALTTIKNSAVWLYPEMMQELLLLGSNAVVNEDALQMLSVREREVAKEIEKGMSNKEIASALGITERTVKAHLSHVYEKLGVSDRLALAMLLRK